jgi:hypothetical protein
MSEHMHKLLVMLLVFLATVAEGQQLKPNEASPEMNRLIRAFEGSYTTVEHHQPHQGFPQGGIRTGTTESRSAAGGNAMFSEVHSHAPQGDLDFMGVFWWDPSAGVYRVLMCAKQFSEGCLTGATARWEGNKLVRTHEENQDGKKIVLRDTISFGADSYTNVAEVSVDDGPMKELIRTMATRQRTNK